jgi:DNA-binding protein WhiA
MRLIRWFYPGLRIKRWLLALLVAAAVFVLAIILVVGPRYWDLERIALLAVYYATGRLLPLAVTGIVVAVLAAAAAIFAMRQVVMSIVQAVAPGTVDEMGQALYLQRQRGRGPRVVAIGGGTGLSTLLRGLKEYTANITAIVTVADDGGSSGRLRGELGILPPGDLRNCLAALAETEPLMAEVFQHRFERGSLAGHTVGNVLIGALAEITGDFVTAVSAASRVLAVRGRVLPSTVDQVQLVARLQDGREVRGESAITAAGGRIAEIRLEPRDARALPEACEAVAAADLIVIGPGSLYTSILPNMLLPELAAAVRQARGTRLFVVNVMTQPGETGGFTAAGGRGSLRCGGGEHSRGQPGARGPVPAAGRRAGALRPAGAGRAGRAGGGGRSRGGGGPGAPRSGAAGRAIAAGVPAARRHAGAQPADRPLPAGRPNPPCCAASAPRSRSRRFRGGPVTNQPLAERAAEEAAHAETQPRAADIAELRGLCRSAGRIHVHDGRAALEVTVDRAPVARRAYRLFRGIGLAAEVQVLGRRYRLQVADARAAIARLGLTSARGIPTRAAARAFLRGLFLGAGSVSAHHLEIVLMDPEVAAQAMAQAGRYGIALHRTERRSATVLYLKDAAQIADYLRLIGATEASFLLEDNRVLHDFRNRANRMANADSANLETAARAAARQVAAIRALALSDLPPGLRQVAELRLRHPELSLRELAALTDPPIGKSGIAHRLRTLTAMAGRGEPLGRKALGASE